jgi:two-component system, chemotaxis family, CheB/CheR fusion protein
MMGQLAKPKSPGDSQYAAPSFVVGIGASAGGLEALQTLFSGLPGDTGMSFVVIQHLARDHKSLMVELLARKTGMPVLHAEDRAEIQPDHVYLIPPGFNLTIQNGRLCLVEQARTKSLNLPIDIFFRSLAADCGSSAIAVVLSGTGSDGARGIRTIKEAGGIVLVQAEASAKFAGMPASAIATGAADFVLSVEDMPGQLAAMARHPFALPAKGTETHVPEDSTDLERICQRLKQVTAIDFANFKHATLARRIERRINMTQAADIGDYVTRLMQSRSEAEALGKDLLISVTKFLRDPVAFDALEERLPEVYEAARPRRTLRVWCAGCATGEEAYTLAMLCERVREKGFPAMDLKVFATDVDRAALEIAGAGIYPRGVVAV